MKIIDEKYGFEIWKQKNILPELFSKQQVNRRPVMDIAYDETNGEIFLKLKPKEGAPTGEEIILSKDMVQKLYKMFVR